MWNMVSCINGGKKSGTWGEYLGSKRDVNGVGIYSLYLSPNIVREIESRRLRWVGHVARMEGGRSAFKILIIIIHIIIIIIIVIIIVFCSL